MSVPPPRRRPICTNCGRPMLGHKRDSQKNYICTPANSPTSDRSTFSFSDSFYTTPSQVAGTSIDDGDDDVASVSSSRLPPVGSWDKGRLSSWHASSTSLDMPEDRWDDESLIPTVLIDSDQMTLRSEPRVEVPLSIHSPQNSQHIHEQTIVRNRKRHQTLSVGSPQHDNMRSITPLTDLGGVNNIPLVFFTAVDSADISRVLDLSKRQGLHAAILHSPSSQINRIPISSSQSHTTGNAITDPNKVVLVLGVDPDIVKQYAEMSHRTMPGTIASERDLMVAPRLITTCQLLCTVVMAIILAIPVFLLCL